MVNTKTGEQEKLEKQWTACLSFGKWRLSFRLARAENPAPLHHSPVLAVLAHLWAALGNWGWLLTALVCLVLGYMLVWQRGPYLDDYFSRVTAIDVMTNRWRPIWPSGIQARMLARVVAYAAGGLLVNHEFLIRGILTLSTGLNALLLGGLIYRVMRSRLAAVVGGWLFLMPIWAQEAVLWAGAPAYIFAVGLLLIFLHAFLSGLTHPERTRGWIMLGTFALAIMLLFVESPVSAAMFVPAFAIIVAQRQTTGYLASFGRSLGMLIFPVAMVGMAYVFLFTKAEIVASRGGFDFSMSGIAERSSRFANSLNMLFLSDWGQRLAGEALDMGLSTLLSSWKGTLLASVAVALVLATALAWRAGEQEYKTPYSVGLLVFIAAIFCSITTLLLPAVLVKGQIPEGRLLYFPLASAGIAAAMFAWMLGKWLRGKAWDKLIVASVGIALLYTTVSMVGFTRAFLARSQLDQKQIAAVVQALPSQYLPDKGNVVYLKTDPAEERLFGKEDSVSAILAGVFEANWSARSALQVAYRRTDFQLFTQNRWGSLSFGREDDKASSASRLWVQGGSAPQGVSLSVSQTVVITGRGGDSAFAIERLTIAKGDGSQEVVEFPIAKELRLRGLPTIDNVMVKG